MPARRPLRGADLVGVLLAGAREIVLREPPVVFVAAQEPVQEPQEPDAEAEKAILGFFDVPECPIELPPPRTPLAEAPEVPAPVLEGGEALPGGDTGSSGLT